MRREEEEFRKSDEDEDGAEAYKDRTERDKRKVVQRSQQIIGS